MQVLEEDNSNGISNDDHEEIDDTDEYYDCLHEVGCDVSQEQLDVWLNSDCNDPGFLIMTA